MIERNWFKADEGHQGGEREDQGEPRPLQQDDGHRDLQGPAPGRQGARERCRPPWAEERKRRYNALGVKGVYVLFCEKLPPNALRDSRLGEDTLKKASHQGEDATDVENRKLAKQLTDGKKQDAALAIAVTA